MENLHLKNIKVDNNYIEYIKKQYGSKNLVKNNNIILNQL